MKKLAYVTANGGFISAEMDYIKAVVYAFELERLGNVEVKVNKRGKAR